jgi:hypothetical protein
MSERYVPAVGDMVRMPTWHDAYEALEVTAVGRFEFLTLSLNGLHEESWSLADEWIQVVKPEPLTETWTAVRADGGTYRVARATSFATAVKMHEGTWPYLLTFAVIHIWTDADGDHAEIERVTK